MLKRTVAFFLIVIFMLSVTASASVYRGNLLMKRQNASGTKIPALIYHKVTENPEEVTDYVVTADTLKADFAEIKARGYTPITVSEYAEIRNISRKMYLYDNFVKYKAFLAQNPKPIIITFDDGYKGIYTHVLPLMKEYNFKVNFYICGEMIDNNNPEYCTWEELKLLYQSGLAEFGNHTYSLHNRSKEELAQLYRSDVNAVLADIWKNKDLICYFTGALTKVFCFPYGYYDDALMKKLKAEDYIAFVSTEHRANLINDSSELLGRFNRDACFTSKEFFDVVEAECR